MSRQSVCVRARASVCLVCELVAVTLHWLSSCHWMGFFSPTLLLLLFFCGFWLLFAIIRCWRWTSPTGMAVVDLRRSHTVSVAQSAVLLTNVPQHTDYAVKQPFKSATHTFVPRIVLIAHTTSDSLSIRYLILIASSDFPFAIHTDESARVRAHINSSALWAEQSQFDLLIVR